MQKLEQVLLFEEAQTIDVYATNPIVLYTGPKFGSRGNLFFDHDFGQMTGNSGLGGWRLQERYDFKRPSDAHLNFGISRPGGGYLDSILGDAHKIKLKW